MIHPEQILSFLYCISSTKMPKRERTDETNSPVKPNIHAIIFIHFHLRF